jgi:hypothetical protein
MGELPAERRDPGWLGLGWVGSGVVGGAAAGILLGVALGQLMSGRASAARSAIAGLGVGVVLVVAVAVVLGVIVDPSAAPGLPPLPVMVVPAVVTGVAGAGLALLMQRSATRLGVWPS